MANKKKAKEETAEVKDVSQETPGSAVVGQDQNDFAMRGKQANDEVLAIQNKYKLTLGTEMLYDKDAIRAKVIWLDAPEK